MAYPPPQGGGYPPGSVGGGPPQRWQPGMGGPAQFDNMPAEAPLDNPNATMGGPPPMQGGMQQFQGYNNVANFGQPFSPMPPPPPPPPPSGQPPPMEFGNVGNLDEQDCREAMIQFVSENCCYGSKPAKEHQIKKIEQSMALHYTLECFCEGRSTGYKHEPFRGQPIDGPENGMPPPPWAIECIANSMFHNHTKLLEVPHTASVKPCHHCDARGYLRCHRCHGRGQVRCHSCGGDGRKMEYNAQTQQHEQVRCFACGGDGRRRCGTCGGDGRITCPTCDGYTRLKCYIELKVTFTNHVTDYIREDTDMPDHLVRDVEGNLLFEQQLPQVWPIQHYPVPDVAQNSVRLVQQARGAYPNEKLLMQRQRLRGVPVGEVACEWEEWRSRYWVYGLERRVHCPDYPQTCCWGCNVL